MLVVRKALNKSYLKLKPNRSAIDNFKKNLIKLLDDMKRADAESEEFHKNLLSDFLKNSYYAPEHFINTKGRNDLVIHNGKDSNSPVGVIIEAKKPSNKYEMITKENINSKAMQELVLYYLRERITGKNLEIKSLIATNTIDWFVFDANLFEKSFANNKELIVLYKILSPEHLLKLPFLNDSNTLDKSFYSELLHIIGLTEKKEGGKKIIDRKPENERNSGSLLESAIFQLYEDIRKEEELFSVGLELVITWINRILFLKLLEAQLINFHKGNKEFAFLNIVKISGFDELNNLFFKVLAVKTDQRLPEVKDKYKNIPYLNSSLFEKSEIEKNIFR